MNETDLWFLCAGAIAASFNAAAGGGTLLSFPALMASGLSPLAANATSTVGLLPGSLASVWAYRRELWALKAEAILILIPAVIGGGIGAWLLLQLGNDVFVKLVPLLLVFAAGMLAAQPWLQKLVQRRAAPESGAAGALATPFLTGLGPSVAVVLFISVYAGYFGAGAGILFLGAMGLVLSRPLGELNALKVLSAAAANGIAAAALAILEWRHPSGALSLRSALPLAAGAILGGYGGVRVAKKLPAWALRAFASTVGLAIAVWIAVR
jgi:uncharacterized membrane protein YfcA